MSENTKDLKNTAEMQDADLENVQGGAGGYAPGAKVHKDCNGVIEDKGNFLGLKSYRYVCSNCGKKAASLDEFDFYLYGLENPFTNRGGF